MLETSIFSAQGRGFLGGVGRAEDTCLDSCNLAPVLFILLAISRQLYE